MTTAVRVSENLVREAKLAEENPDLTYRLIKEILIGIEELNQGECTKYKFG